MRAFHSIAGRGHIGRGAPCSDSGCLARGRRSILQAVCRHACCKPLHLLVRPGLSLVFGAGDDSEYCDGWSEKQFDVGQASSKCLGWIGSNPPHLAGSDTGESITGLVCIVPSACEAVAPLRAPWATESTPFPNGPGPVEQALGPQCLSLTMTQ